MGQSVDATLLSRYKKEQVLDLARRSLTSVLAHFALFLFVALITPMKDDHPGMIGGFGLVVFLVSGIRMVLARKIPRSYDQSPEILTRMLMGLNYTSGLLWGVFGVVMAVYYPLEWPFLFTLVINCGLAAGATSSLGPHFTLSRNFTLIMLMPISIWGFVNGSSLGISIGVLCIFSMLMFIRMAKDNYIWYWESMASSERISQHTKTIERVFKGVHDNSESLNQNSKNLSGYSGEMNRQATDMAGELSRVAGIADRVNTNSTDIVGLMAQATENFSNIASATEEMTATIAGIAESTEKTSETTARAANESEAATAQMEGLESSATAINKITETIGDISGQINLLALNATIEAARAGEAGKGFAVVATEIKELAVQTAGSVGEINRQVKEIQEATQRSSRQMDSITNIVQEANSRVGDFAKAVDEQLQATNEVSKNINEASSGFTSANQMITENDEGLKQMGQDISQLEKRAKAVEKGAGDVDENAETLRGLAREMVALVEKGA